MIKKFTFAFAALIGFSTQSFAWQPYGNDPISDAPSVLVKTDAPVADAAAADVPAADVPAAVEDAHAAETAVIEQSPASEPVADVAAPPMAASAPVSQSAPMYYRPARRANKSVLGELVELERRKNAWLKRTFLGR